ncbi:MAG: hypothetical protein EBY81_04445 [Verrucomicrobia bacterium]|nr:hypothetical protein [Verrucomicrobiota bacterium]
MQDKTSLLIQTEQILILFKEEIRWLVRRAMLFLQYQEQVLQDAYHKRLQQVAYLLIRIQQLR